MAKEVGEIRMYDKITCYWWELRLSTIIKLMLYSKHCTGLMIVVLFIINPYVLNYVYLIHRGDIQAQGSPSLQWTRKIQDGSSHKVGRWGIYT